MFAKNKTTRIAILGRPNVGKSTLFNLLIRRRTSVVKNQAGVTRDILIENTEWWGHSFDIIDTGGLTESKDAFSQLIRAHLVPLVKNFDALILVMDGRAGLIPEDRDLVRLAVESQKPFIIVVNKIDQMHKADLMTSEFFEFGRDIIPASFEKRDNIDKIVEWIIGQVVEEDNSVTEGLSLAILGKPNVGKSSLCNQLLGMERMLVSDIAGTTVDPVESAVIYNKKQYKIVDTAGLRRSSKREDGVEYIAAIKALESIGRAEIILLMVDACEGPSVQDCKIIEAALERHKAIILVANKSDLAQKEILAYRKKFREKTEQQIHFFTDIPLCFVSARTGAGLKDLFKLVNEVWEKLNISIPTSQLNKFFYEAIRGAPSPVYRTKNVKFYYLTQTQQRPPSFIAFANYPDGVKPSYRRFLSNKIKNNWNLDGIPIRIFIMKSG